MIDKYEQKIGQNRNLKVFENEKIKYSKDVLLYMIMCQR